MNPNKNLWSWKERSIGWSLMGDANGDEAVLLIHGHADSSDSWIVNGEKSVAIILVNAGYDVWLANTRGNKYSEQHVWLNPDEDTEYWSNSIPDYSAKYDFPAFIEKVASIANVENMTVIAHSLATRNMLMNLAENSTFFGSRINYLALLAPFTEAHSSTFVNSVFTKANKLVDDLAPSFLKIHRSFKPNSIFNLQFKYLCGYTPWFCDLMASQMS